MTNHHKIGVFLPNVVPDAPAGAIAEWATRAEARGFDTLAAVDRIAYDSSESLIALAVAAGATERIDLATNVLISPLRETTLLAKQAASLDRASGGRLTLGLGVGIREDDFAVCGASPRGRGARFDEQLAQLRATWSGATGIGPAPVTPGGPALLIGGDARLAAPRIAEHGQGWTMMVGTPDQFAASLDQVRAAWRAAGRPGQPRAMAVQYAALGPAADRATAAMTHYYGWLGADIAGWIASTAATTEQALADRVAEFAAAGADEIVIAPCSADPDQVDRFADVVVRTPALV
ncbi:MAG: LLM class flavin-dependent oxidoreductase [Jatrophihabitans sp.]|uniref:LLM class flavin-dependent oxidoreductase n=1 Tax=Jatrophihabitans sp. TaxID=1932789 RepID=UPI003F8178B1